MKHKRYWFIVTFIIIILLGRTPPTPGQSSGTVQGGAYNLPGLNEQPVTKYEVFLSEGKYRVEITVTLDPASDAESVELRDEGFGGTPRAQIYRGTAKTIILSTKLLSLRPNQDRRAFGTYQITILGPAQ